MKSGTRLALTLVALLTAALCARAQQPAQPAADTGSGAAASAPAALALARAALKAQGGDGFVKLRSLIMKGTAEISKPGSVQSLPAKFIIVMSGDNCRVELRSPLFTLQQIYDGQQNYLNMPGVNFPPITKFGLNLLTRFEQPGYVVSELPQQKKQKGFRITGPDGNSTDFYADPASGQVVSYTIQHNFTRKGEQELSVKFTVEHKKMKEVEGVLVPYNFAQRIDTAQGSFFAEYKVVEVKINQPVAENVFIIPKRR